MIYTILALAALCVCQGHGAIFTSEHFAIHTGGSWTFDDGMAFCNREYGTHLACLYTKSLNNEAKDLARRQGSSVLTGGNDFAVEGKWVWACDRSELTYEDWIPGEPNNSGGNEDALHLRNTWNYKWNDGHAHNPVSAIICERPGDWCCQAEPGARKRWVRHCADISTEDQCYAGRNQGFCRWRECPDGCCKKKINVMDRLWEKRCKGLRDSARCEAGRPGDNCNWISWNSGDCP